MNAIKEALMRVMEAYFAEDTKRIKHAHRVTVYSVLHDIGIHQAEKKYGSTSGGYFITSGVSFFIS